MAIPLVALTLATACGDERSVNIWDGGIPSTVEEAVRDEHPRTPAEDVAFLYGNAKDRVPDASDEDVTRWRIEALDYNAQAEEWKACREEDPDGSNCDEIDEDTMSLDNPLGP